MTILTLLNAHAGDACLENEHENAPMAHVRADVSVVQHHPNQKYEYVDDVRHAHDDAREPSLHVDAHDHGFH